MPNAATEQSRSLWMEETPFEAPPIASDAQADVVVVGAGISGLSAAYELAAQGRSVIVLDKGVIGGGMTMRTSAHLSYELDDYYFKLIKRRSEDAARAYYESQKAAVDRIEAIVRAEAIDCDFARIDAFLVASGPEGEATVEDELEGARKAGFNDASLARVPESFGSVAIKFPNQARFHPAKYIRGLAGSLARQGAQLYANSHVSAFKEESGAVRVTLANGANIKARIGVVATNSPVNDKLAIHTKQAPYRTYVFAAPMPKGALPDALIWDTEEPYHYVRIQPGQAEDIVLVGGEDHKSGLEDDGKARIARLREWAMARIPGLGETTHAWSGQVYEPIDFVPHMGRNPGDKNVYVITGDSGEGLTSGVAGALLIAQLVAEGSSPWEDLYEPDRKKIGGATTFLRENVDVAANFTEHLTGGEVDSVEALAPGSGALVRSNGKKIAAYRDKDGGLHTCSAVCPHMGCIVKYNSFERCWDCPCHGSQFDVHGEVLAGPSRAPLERLDL